MPSIRITQFAGLLPEVNPKALRNDHAQIAHNCLLWDGWLRPMPQWTVVSSFATQPRSLIKLHSAPAGFFVSDFVDQGIFVENEPYTVNYVGLLNGVISKVIGTSIFHVGLPIPPINAAVQTVTPNFLSTYPIPRTYAITFLSDASESPPFVLPELGALGDVFEGDIINLSLTVNVGALANYHITGYRLYRTVPQFDTGEQIGNPAETGFHLVTDVTLFGAPPPMIAYSDTRSSEQIPGDLLLTDQFMEPTLNTSFLRQTESGWLVAVEPAVTPITVPSVIQISERYLWDAWPPQNTVRLPANVTGVTVFYDDVFFGTLDYPYHMRIEMGDNDALNLSIRPFPDEYRCVPNTLVTTNFGAMYASPDGLVALQVQGDHMLSKKVTNPGDQLGGQNIRIDSALQGMWWNGNYFGLCDSVGYVFNVPNESTNEFPLAQLVTIDVPHGSIGATVVTGSGLFALWGTNLYTFPLPGYGYDTAPKMAFRWKSRRYVLPGMYTMAAAKVVNDGSGTLTFTAIGDGQIIISRAVTDSDPFRFPHQHKVIEWEFVLEGTSVVSELHVATSIRELTEEPGGG